ncbi:MFS transporter [Roseisolibacter sp. H3M3-2]|uniref:MFS transporter n=1 Tax=Roseisolibacter sp. H3M3-2 TaxID=3031323 RepID=UPI0023DA28C8|nr:MFS transporter [Roseisolibacter sp. H3M3-2]MDF1503346.1 MFS transporter [Roseisolibacter sp. H3M3-2]
MSSTLHRDALAEKRRVVLASAVGTTIEWYDFFIYSTSAALVFGSQFFSSLDPATAQLAAMATLGVTFLIRPLGSVVAGHYGDRLGRKKMLVLTLGVMGAATVGVGLLPTYAQAGIWAPVLLVLMRCLQGFSAGGEWAGAALMAVEHAPPRQRAWYGSSSQIGTPLGLILANGVVLTMVSTTTEQQFLAWGWRIPFLLSVVLIFVGFYIRNRVSESPVFAAMKAQARTERAPIGELLREHKRAVVLAGGTFLANNMVGYIFLSFLLSYATTTLGMARGTVLGMVIAGSVVWFFAILFGGWISDRIGARRIFLVGFALMLAWCLPFMWLVDRRSPGALALAVVGLTITKGLTYGGQSALYAGLFPTRVRYSGASLAYALGAILGGGFAPVIATYLVQRTGTGMSVGLYMLAATAVSLLCTVMIRRSDMVGLPHGPDLAAGEAGVATAGVDTAGVVTARTAQ